MRMLCSDNFIIVYSACIIILIEKKLSARVRVLGIRMNLFKHYIGENLLSSTRNIFFVSWLKSFSIRRYNLSFVSLILGAICIGLTIGWQENFVIHYAISSCLNGMCLNVENFKSTARLALTLGACLGALVPPCLVHIFGRRSNFAIIAVLDFASWFILTLVMNIPMMFIGAGICGLVTGFFVVIATIYIGEVIPAQSRGTSTALVTFFVYIGILFSRILSLFIQNRIVPFTMSLVTLGFLMTIYYWMIESPYYLYERGETLNAKLALKKLRGEQNILDIDVEFKSIEFLYASKEESIHKNVNTFYSTFMIDDKQVWKTVISLLLIISQTIGEYVIENHVERFLGEALPSYEKSIVSFLDILSIGLCIHLIKTIGRKRLLFISIGSSSFSCLNLATYNFIHATEFIIISDGTDRILKWIIVALNCSAYIVGLTPILPLLTGEVFSNRIKILNIGLCTSLIYLGIMLLQIVFEALDEHTGTYIASIAFSIIGVFGLFSLLIFEPTQNSTHCGIQNELNDVNVFLS